MFKKFRKLKKNIGGRSQYKQKSQKYRKVEDGGKPYRGKGWRPEYRGRDWPWARRRHLRKGGGYRSWQVCKGEQERRGSFSNGFYLGGEVTE